MPAKDIYHDAVVNALQKADWNINDEQVALDIGVRRLWLDLQVSSSDNTRLIEVKSFIYSGSDIAYLMSAIGQYTLYQSILRRLTINYDLYLAVPVAAYQTLLQEPVGQSVIEYTSLNLLVYHPKEEMVEQWVS